MKKKQMKQCIVSMLMAVLLTGCGSAGGKSAMTDSAASSAENSAAGAYENYDTGIAYDNYTASDAVTEEMGVEAPAKNNSETENQTQNIDNLTLMEEKLVYHCDMDIETLDYASTIAAIKDTISKYGGIIQSENESDSGIRWYYEDYQKTSATMHNYLQVRVPSKNYNSFLSELDGVGKIISRSTSVDNITQRYYDTTSQIEALKIQEKNLLDMMEKCETIEDMITVEQRLSDVQYQLSQLQTSRRYMDMDVAYSYVNINITEVMEYRQTSEPVKRNTFIDRLKNTVLSTGRGFLSFLEGLLFLLISVSPYMLIIAFICFVVLRKKIRHFMEIHKTKKAEKQNQKQDQNQ